MFNLPAVARILTRGSEITHVGQGFKESLRQRFDRILFPESRQLPVHRQARFDHLQVSFCRRDFYFPNHGLGMRITISGTEYRPPGGGSSTPYKKDFFVARLNSNNQPVAYVFDKNAGWIGLDFGKSQPQVRIPQNAVEARIWQSTGVIVREMSRAYRWNRRSLRNPQP